MQNLFVAPFGLFNPTVFFMKQITKTAPKIAEAAINQSIAAQTYWMGLSKYVSDFWGPSFNALNAFAKAEKTKLPETSWQDNLKDYLGLMAINNELAFKGFSGSLLAMDKYFYKKVRETFSAWVDTVLEEEEGKGLAELSAREREALDVTVNHYPEAIKKIKPEYGFHFEQGGYIKAFETERFDFYQVLPSDKGIATRQSGKPVLIVPPYVLGPNILAFLPKESRSYVHCFANQGIPTYVRIVKEIGKTPAVQLMTGEDDASDIRYFCEKMSEKHGKPVTLNGFCQGGYHCMAALLSGELDGVVDALVTCASPMDGTRSNSLTKYMMSLPPRFRDMVFSLKTLPNGNQVVDGKIMGWVYKLRKIEAEAPVAAFHRDLSMFESQRGATIKISKTASAINHWITYDQQDLPVAITKMSFDAYSTPVTRDGELPVKLFGRTLNFKRLKEKGISWLLCIADNDDLVDKEASLAPLEFVDAEVSIFPKGHASIATSWSIPTSECALHMRFCSPTAIPLAPNERLHRGPVCFHLDLDQKLDAEAPKEGKPKEGGSDTDKVALISPPAVRKRGRRSKGLKVVEKEKDAS